MKNPLQYSYLHNMVVMSGLKTTDHTWPDKSSLIFKCHLNDETLTCIKIYIARERFLIITISVLAFPVSLNTSVLLGRSMVSPLKVIQVLMALSFTEQKNNKRIYVKENCDHRFHF